MLDVDIPTANAWSMATEDIRAAMREAVKACTERGLYFAGRWAAEALTGLPQNNGKRAKKEQDTTTPWTQVLFPSSKMESENVGDIEAEEEQDNYLLAKTLFDLKEYYRAADVLKGQTNSKSQFLRLYSTYLVGEKREQQERGEIFSHFDNAAKINKELFRIEQELEDGYDAGTLDAFCKYLYGVVLIKTRQVPKALTVLIESVHEYPYNWSAWLEIASCIPNEESAYSLLPQLPVNYMTSYFLLHATIDEPIRHVEYEKRWAELSAAFPRSAYVQCEWARYLAHVPAPMESIEKFEELVQANPYRLDYMHVFSDSLFLAHKYDQLSHLARRCVQIDSFRPETCFVIGNYYSAKGEPEQSIMYFKRCLRFNRGFAQAWTLLGLEYMEVKNAYSAVEAFRRAVDLNIRDYRAWNGLGQAYEAQMMPHVACQHYRRAVAIRPQDAQLWVRVADMLVLMGDERAAITCYRRVLEIGNNQATEIRALKVLPGLYAKAGDIESAAEFYERSMPHLRETPYGSGDLANAIMFLARYERDNGNIQKATEYATEALSASTVRHQEDAKILLREMGVMTDNDHDPQGQSSLDSNQQYYHTIT
ncbi:anaphase-promoting complex component apc8 [Gryganskiella cystojenkinii]|nr:anaphase-promoting complex component apc8 [Gryganskiella cystojenkinii]